MPPEIKQRLQKITRAFHMRPLMLELQEVDSKPRRGPPLTSNFLCDEFDLSQMTKWQRYQFRKRVQRDILRESLGMPKKLKPGPRRKPLSDEQRRIKNRGF